MLVPIAKVMKNPKQKEGIVFYNTEDGTTKYMKCKEILKGIGVHHYAGIYCTDHSIRLYRTFNNIGTLGEEQEIESFTICQKIVTKGSTKYLLVDILGNTNISDGPEVIALISAGINIAGGYLKNDRLYVDRDIETVTQKEITNILE